VPYYWGFCSILVSANLVATVIGYEAAALLTLELAAGLLFLTPLYFILSMLRASDTLADRLALLFGFALGPIVYVTLPGFELVLSGLVGGTAAYLVDRRRRQRA
jgi:predicted branched-subunit amino acid permease